MSSYLWNFGDGGELPVKAWSRGVAMEDGAKDQVRRTAALPFVYKHVAVMPDAHAGRGSTVGSVIPTKGAIIPAAVGVDLGCGMMAVQTHLSAEDLPDSLAGLRSAIEASIPHGRTEHGGPGDRGAWGDPPADVVAAYGALGERLEHIVDRTPGVPSRHRRPHAHALAHLGTLGTGNHFIEICLDEAGAVWVMLHSGSRGIGNRIGSYFIEAAKQDMRRWFINLPDEDLAYLPEGSETFEAYVEAVSWAQDYARANREVMMQRALAAISGALGRPVYTEAEAVNCHHNYIAKENHFGANVWVTRKGAVRARKGDLGIIPGSMGAKSFIVRGRGNADAFHSCSHGAGRAMSRGEARRRFTIEDHIRATDGVECRKDDSVIDETPAAYKDIDAVMAAQADLVEIVHTLRQVVCVKG